MCLVLLTQLQPHQNESPRAASRAPRALYAMRAARVVLPTVLTQTTGFLVINKPSGWHSVANKRGGGPPPGSADSVEDWLFKKNAFFQ